MKTFACALVLLSSAAFAAGSDAWVLVRDENSTSMHGSIRDLEAARSHLREFGPGYLWFRHDGREYVVRDGALLEDLAQALEPQEELGLLQGKLGRRQGELGREQGRLGREQAALGRQQARAALVRARRQLDGARGDPDGDEERRVAETQRELGRAQEALGREQQKIGEEQQKLGREQERLSRELERKVGQLIAAALRTGSARPVD